MSLLRHVLDATLLARGAGADRSYLEVARRLGSLEWSLDPVARELVATALGDLGQRIGLNPAALGELVNRIAEILYEDPRTSVRLERWWNELREARP